MSLIPFVEGRYSVCANPDNRALGGLSMGGMQTINFGFPNADKFHYLMPSSPAPGIQGQSQLFPNGGALARANLKLIFFSCGSGEVGSYGCNNVNTVRGYAESNGLGSIIEEFIVQGGAHNAATWRPSFWNYAQLAHQAGFTTVGAACGGGMGGMGGMGGAAGNAGMGGRGGMGMGGRGGMGTGGASAGAGGANGGSGMIGGSGGDGGSLGGAGNGTGGAAGGAAGTDAQGGTAGMSGSGMTGGAPATGGTTPPLAERAAPLRRQAASQRRWRHRRRRSGTARGRQRLRLRAPGIQADDAALRTLRRSSRSRLRSANAATAEHSALRRSQPLRGTSRFAFVALLPSRSR